MMQTPVRIGLPAELTREERIAQLRERMARLEGAPREAAGVEESAGKIESLPPELREVLPSGGLRRGDIALCTPTPLLVAEVVATVSAAGGMVAVVGWPELAYAQVSESGGALGNVVAVPNPGLVPLDTVAVLAGGMDLVVYRGVEDLTPNQARPLWAKVRKGRAAVLAAGSRIPRAHTSICAKVVGFEGISAGTGRICSVSIDLRCESKIGTRSATMVVGARQNPRRLRAV